MSKKLALKFGLVGHPDRVRILLALEKTAEMSVNQITKAIRISQPAASHHLGNLKQATLVRVRKAGARRLYSIHPDAQPLLRCLLLMSDHKTPVSTNELIYIWDIKTGAQEWRGDIDAALGYAPGEFPRTMKAWERQVHPDDRPRIDEAAERHLASRAPFFLQYRMKRKDGSYVSWLDCGSAMVNDAQRPYKWIGMTRVVGNKG